MFSSVALYKIDLHPGRCSSVVEVRLLRFWERRRLKRGGELTGYDMILMDVTESTIHARISSDCLPLFRGRLTAGLLYSVSGFDVGPSVDRYKLTVVPLLIRFNESTSMESLANPVTSIPPESFHFCDADVLLQSADTHSLLPDVLGEFTAVKSTVREPLKGKNHVMATIKLDNGPSVILSLFDSLAVSFHRRLESMIAKPRVIVATNVNPRLVGAHLFLNATSGTHVYFDGETLSGQRRFDQLIRTNTSTTLATSVFGLTPKVETMTISQINSLSTTSLSEDVQFQFVGSVTRVGCHKGWCFVGCNRCSKELKRTLSGFECVRCDKINVLGVLRYRLTVAISDDTAERDFVVHDGVMTGLHGLEAREAGLMVVGEGVNPEDSPIPGFISDMEGKTYVFHVKLDKTACQTFTITRILAHCDGESVRC